MPSFLTGDELGSIKAVSYTKVEKEWKSSVTVLVDGVSSGKARAIQKLSVHRGEGSSTLLAAARADGSASLLNLTENSANVVSEWREPRLKEGQRYVGLASSSRGVYSCTSNGALRLKPEQNDVAEQIAVLPMRLAEWRLSPDQKTFAYAGDEVELSVWDAENAFSPSMEQKSSADTSKKRKRSDQLLPGETWRAKNLPNDSLNLRQPVRNNCLTYLQSSGQPQLLVGTQFGDVRRYDTRTARRPVSNWKGIGKVGGIGLVEKGIHENEVFVADHGCNLFAVDLRNGRVAYGYKGLSGAVTSVAPSPNFLGSVASDRFLRLHSTFPPPADAGQQQEHKGEVLDKLYMKVVPTAILVDPRAKESEVTERDGDSDDEADDDVWENMEEAESDAESAKASRKKKKTKTG